MAKNGDGNCHSWCGRLTIKFEDGDEVVKMMDENFDELKKWTTSWDKMYQGAKLFYPLVDEETHYLDAPAGLVREQSTQVENMCREYCAASTWNRQLF